LSEVIHPLRRLPGSFEHGIAHWNALSDENSRPASAKAVEPEITSEPMSSAIMTRRARRLTLLAATRTGHPDLGAANNVSFVS
jgi:hypothetical protein